MVGATPYWERLVVLAPVWVVGAGLVLGLGILLVRAGVESWRESNHKRLIIWLLVGLCCVVAFLTYLGVTIPNMEE